MFKKIAAALILLTLTGCGPMYVFKNEYVPPNSDQGRSCAANCISNLSMCQNQCRAEKNNCEMMNQVSSIAQDALKANSKRPSQYGTGYQRYCSSDYNCMTNCESTRQSCHKMCGGEVITHKTCTAFCDQTSGGGLFSD